jgi:hypothetical protein
MKHLAGKSRIPPSSIYVRDIDWKLGKMFGHEFHLFNEQDLISSFLEATRNDFVLSETKFRESPMGWIS